MIVLSHKIKSVIAVIILVLSTTLSGCAFKDLDKRNFVVAIGVDPASNGNEGFKVTLKIARAIGNLKEATNPTYAYISYESNKISDAIRNMESRVDKVLEFGQTKVIILSKELLDTDYQQFMDYFIRRGDIQLVTWMAAASPSAEDILKVEPDTEAPSTIALFNTFDSNGTDSPFVTTTYLYEFRRDYFSKGMDTVIPLITTDEDHSELITNKSMVLKKEHPSLELDPFETLYYNSLFLHATGYSYKVEDEDMTLYLNVQKMKMKYKIITNKSSPAINIKINVTGTVLESNKPLDPAKLKEYNKMAAKDMKKVTEDLLKKLQAANLDPFAFGIRYRATRFNHKNTFSDWEKMYPTIELNIDFDVDLQSIGAIK